MTSPKKLAKMKSIKFGLGSIGLLLVMASGCAKEDSSSIDQNVVDSATAAATAVGGVVEEDDSGSQVSLLDPATPLSIAARAFRRLAVPERLAYASTCPSFSSASCASSSKQVTYSDCQVGTSSLRLNGSVEQDYTNPSCNFSSIGDSLTRKLHSVQLILENGATIENNTDSVSDYLGDSLGSAGATVLMTGSGAYRLSISGIRKTVLSSPTSSNPIVDVTERTAPADPIQITGGLARGGRLVATGTLQIYHNKAKFVATHKYSNVYWSDANCCFPQSGSTSITFSGSLTGTADIQFGPGCGQYTITKEGAAYTGTMTVCR